MARADIPNRQKIIRQWWLQNAMNPLLLKAFTASWNETVHMERWMDMQARCACFEHGAILGPDANWKVISDQLRFSPLWLLKNWHLQSIRKISKRFLSAYFVIENKKGLWVARQAPSEMRQNISEDPGELYEWLGVTGGYKYPVPPDPEEEDDADTN